MVDSILDNLSLRSQRRVDIRLELEPQTKSANVLAFVSGLKEILRHKDVQLANVYLAEITSDAILILSDYYTAPMPIAEFNLLRQEINMACLRLLEELQIETAGANTDVRIVKED
jgi:MscS family membrane protein